MPIYILRPHGGRLRVTLPIEREKWSFFELCECIGANLPIIYRLPAEFCLLANIDDFRFWRPFNYQAARLMRFCLNSSAAINGDAVLFHHDDLDWKPEKTPDMAGAPGGLG